MAETDSDLDSVETDTDTDSKSEKVSMTSEQKAAVRMISRELWRSDCKSEMSVEEKKAGWTAGRRKYTTSAKRLFRALEKHGIQMTASEDKPTSDRKKKKAKADA